MIHNTKQQQNEIQYDYELTTICLEQTVLWTGTSVASNERNLSPRNTTATVSWILWLFELLANYNKYKNWTSRISTGVAERTIPTTSLELTCSSQDNTYASMAKKAQVSCTSRIMENNLTSLLKMLTFNTNNKNEICGSRHILQFLCVKCDL